MRIPSASIGIFAAFSLFALTAPAGAQNRLVTVQGNVSFKDLDLSRDRDVAVLRERVDRLISDLCQSGPFARRAIDDRCATEAKARSRLQIENAIQKARPERVASTAQ